MPGLVPVQPDHDLCVICGRPAAGRCAVCHALVCADCAVLEQGLGKPVAVCRRCARKRPRAGRRLLSWLVVPALLAAGAVVVLLLLRG